MFRFGSAITITDSCIFGNSGSGADIGVDFNNNKPIQMQASNNWWGHETGPSHSSNPDGQGETLAGDINFSPFTTTQPRGCQRIVDHPDLIAQDDTYNTQVNTPLVVSALGVLDNDVSARALPLTATLVSDVKNGSLVFNTDGGFVYTPNTGYAGKDQFTYYADDGTLTSTPATASIIVIASSQDVVTAQDDSFKYREGTTLVVPAPGVLSNDIEPNNLPLTAVLDTNPTNGTLTLNADGSFSYHVNNGSTNSMPATVSLSLKVPPQSADDTYSTEPNTVLNVAAPGVLANDSPPAALTATNHSDPDQGTLTLNSDGSFVYTPPADFIGETNFTYVANDGLTESLPATVTIHVAENTAPIAIDDEYYVVVNGGYGYLNDPIGVLANDQDAEDNPLTAILVSQPERGNLDQFNADGTFTYVIGLTTTGGSEPGTVTFTYKVSDGKDESNEATVTIEIVDVPPRPIPTNLNISGGIMTHPTFNWTHIGDGPNNSLVPNDWYQVVVLGDTFVHDQWYPFLNHCEGTACSVTPDLDLIDGTYSWYVRSFSMQSRTFTESKPATFAVDTDGIPAPDVIDKVTPRNGNSFSSGLVTLCYD